MKVVVDYDVCQSHGHCAEAAPELFEVRSDGFMYILNDTPPVSLSSKLEAAMRDCPTGAIKLQL